MNEAEQKLWKIHQKISQVLRIKKRLEARRQSRIQQLHNTSDPMEIWRNLYPLANICKREEKVVVLSEKGTIESLKILEESEEIVNDIAGFPRRLGSFAVRLIPIIGKKIASPHPLLPLIKIMYSYLRKLIGVIVINLDHIKRNIIEQHRNILELIEEVREAIDKAEAHINITKSKNFVKLEELHQEELAIVQRTEEEFKSIRGKMVTTVSRINIKISQNPRLLKAQVAFWVLPIFGPVAAGGTILFGTETWFLSAGLGLVVNHAPLIAILMKESAILLKKPAKRSHAAAILRMKIIKSKLEVPSTMMRELATIAAGGVANRARQAANVFT